MQNRCLIVLSPVYNDWLSYSILLDRCEEIFKKEGFTDVKFIAVDDCSSEQFANYNKFTIRQGHNEVIELSRNVGHQKAIAIGLAYIYNTYPDCNIVVMDSDGEDSPEHTIKLFYEGIKTGRIVFAKRHQRSEGPLFTIFYKIYKKTFYSLTGHKIDFGNFSFIPYEYLHKVVSLSEIWNHYAVGIARAKLPFTKILLSRGKRYDGKSKMSFASLIIHGLSAISVFSDVVATRLIISSLTFIFLSLLGMGVIIFIRLFTNLAIPGWTSNVVLGLTIIIFQAFFMALLMAFMILSNRSQINFIPARGYNYFINKIYK